MSDFQLLGKSSMLVLKLLPVLLLVLPTWALPAKCEKKEFAETQAKYQQCAAAKIASISKALEVSDGANIVNTREAFKINEDDDDKGNLIRTGLAICLAMLRQMLHLGNPER